MGKHYLLNLYGCSFVLLDDEICLIDLLENAAIASGATVIQTISKKFEPQGVTVICLLSESHISIHTWPEFGSCAVDLYSLKEYDFARSIADVLKLAFEANEYDLKVMHRMQKI